MEPAAKKLKQSKAPFKLPPLSSQSLTASSTQGLPEELRYKIEHYAAGVVCSQYLETHLQFLKALKSFQKNECIDDHCMPSCTWDWGDQYEESIGCGDSDCFSCLVLSGCSNQRYEIVARRNKLY
jgi:hypothetical protein